MTPTSRWQQRRGKLLRILLLSLAVLVAVAVFLVGWEVVQRRLVPEPSVGLNHFLITARALTLTVSACALVYGLMRRQQRVVAETADRLAKLLEAYMADPTNADTFENPHLQHCSRMVDCADVSCPMHDVDGKRCWQVMALSRVREDGLPPAVEIERCHECDVFRLSAPDEVTALGEDVNNLMFLLRAGARETERLRAQMVEREKMYSIGQLAAGLAHEVGNPLSSISAIVQVLKRSGVNGGMGEQLDLMETHIHRITTTVRQLSRLARKDDDRWSVVDVGKALEDTVKLVSFDERARNVEIECSPLPSIPQTFAVPGQVEQVFLNLMLNALDAMPDGGKLLVEAHASRTRITVKIQDTGSGIPAATGQRIFTPFFTTKEPGRGTGLGLAVCYTAIQKLGGTIEYESAEGQGTVFTVELPVLNGPLSATERRN